MYVLTNCTLISDLDEFFFSLIFVGPSFNFTSRFCSIMLNKTLVLYFNINVVTIYLTTSSFAVSTNHQPKIFVFAGTAV